MKAMGVEEGGAEGQAAVAATRTETRAVVMEMISVMAR